MKSIGAFLLWTVVALALIVGLVFAVGGVRWITAEFRGEASEREQTQADGSYRIASYDRFFDLCASIQALEDQRAEMEANTSLPEDQRETNVLALTNQRNTLIRRYNADASKTDTRGNFLASELPYRLDTTQETTSCTP